MSKICLVVIFNHNFERNIELIKRIYRGRFSNVVILMPFYRGKDPSVISVYENSYQFNGYITQAREALLAMGCDQYIFIPDDMVLNPKVNEGNVCEVLGIDSQTGFISECNLMTDKILADWMWMFPSVRNMRVSGNSCEWTRFLPSVDEAWKLFEEKGFSKSSGATTFNYEFISRFLSSRRDHYFCYKYAKGCAKFVRRFHRLKLASQQLYPLATGYSDIFTIPGSSMADFCHYSGVMSAIRIFVEVAVPTTMVFSCPRVRTLKDVGMKGEGTAYQKVRELELATGRSYGRLLEQFPNDYLYLHAIKLSSWSNLP